MDVSKDKSSDNSLNLSTGLVTWSVCLSLPFVNQEFLKFIFTGSVQFYCKSLFPLVFQTIEIGVLLVFT